PVTAYQLTSMMRGVVERGTATRLQSLGVPLAGKTGTTNESRDAWFIGFTPNMVAGCYIGYDTPRPMGRGAFGGTLCAPVFEEFMKVALKDRPAPDFEIPPGAVMVKVDRATGRRLPDDASGGGVAVEAFRRGQAPEIGEFTGGEVIGASFGMVGGAGSDLPMRLPERTPAGAEEGAPAAPRGEDPASGSQTGPSPSEAPEPGGDFGSGGLY
ncbi:MAG: penicillin-binding transpeptidase domain-containing protein, partial [Pseudomonadota bacterium]